MLTLDDKGRRGVGEILTLAKKGGRGLLPSFCADRIGEEPLKCIAFKTYKKSLSDYHY